MKVKQSSRAKPRTKFNFINLNPTITKRNYEAAKKLDYKKLGDLVAAEYGEAPKFKGPHLVLSAGNTKTSKGYLNAINCRNMFADGPNIDFLPQDSFGGKIE